MEHTWIKSSSDWTSKGESLFDFSSLNQLQQKEIKERALRFFKQIWWEECYYENFFTEYFFGKAWISIHYCNGKIILWQLLRWLYYEDPVVCVMFLNLLTKNTPYFALLHQNNQYCITVTLWWPGSPVTKHVNRSKAAVNDTIYDNEDQAIQAA